MSLFTTNCRMSFFSLVGVLKSHLASCINERKKPGFIDQCLAITRPRLFTFQVAFFFPCWYLRAVLSNAGSEERQPPLCSGDNDLPLLSIPPPTVDSTTTSSSPWNPNAWRWPRPTNSSTKPTPRESPGRTSFTTPATPPSHIRVGYTTPHIPDVYFFVIDRSTDVTPLEASSRVSKGQLPPMSHPASLDEILKRIRTFNCAIICQPRFRLKQVQEQVAELEAKLAKLTAEFNAANKDKQEVSILGDHGSQFEKLGTS